MPNDEQAGAVTGGGRPAPAVRIPPGEHEPYRQLATTADLLGKALENLSQGAMMAGVPDPESLGAAGADWPNFENSGVVLQAWARLVLDALERPAGGLIIVERKVQRP